MYLFHCVLLTSFSSNDEHNAEAYNEQAKYAHHCHYGHNEPCQRGLWYKTLALIHWIMKTEGNKETVYEKKNKKRAVKTQYTIPLFHKQVPQDIMKKYLITTIANLVF